MLPNSTDEVNTDDDKETWQRYYKKVEANKSYKYQYKNAIKY